MTTFADIKIGEVFYIHFAGEPNVKCLKKTSELAEVTRPNGTMMEMKCYPNWEIKTEAEKTADEDQKANFKRQKAYMETHPVRDPAPDPRENILTYRGER